MKKIFFEVFSYSHPIYDVFSKCSISNAKLYQRVEKKYMVSGTFHKIKENGSISKYVFSNNNFFDKCKLAIKNIFSIPAISFSRLPPGMDVMQGTNSAIYTFKFPWLTDTDVVTSFYRHSDYEIGSSLSKKIIALLLKRSECKGILAWSNAAKKSVETYFNSDMEIINKTYAILPGAPLSNHITDIPKDKFRFLFVSRLFYEKGGREIINAFLHISKKVDAELHLVCPLPKEFRDKIFKSDNIVYHGFPISRDELNKLYSNCHCLLFPSYFDSYGYVVIEAKSHGVPAICTDVFALPELVTNGETGIVLESPISWYGKNHLPDKKKYKTFDNFSSIIKSFDFTEFSISLLATAMLEIISDRSTWSKMSKNCIREIESGIFSMTQFSRRLSDIYGSL